MNKFEWKQSDRSTCPKCGSEDFKEFSKKQEFFMGLGGFLLLLPLTIFIPIILIPFVLGILIFSPLFYFFPETFLGKKVLRKCKKCKKQWRYLPDPKQKAEAN